MPLPPPEYFTPEHRLWVHPRHSKHSALYSPVGSIWLLRALLKADMLGPHLLVLAQDVEDHLEEYIGLISTLRATYGEKFSLILDNGAAEGDAMDFPRLMQIASIIKPTWAQFPDVLGDAHATLTRLELALDDLRQYGYCEHFPQVRWMAVVQGTSFTEVQYCIREMTDLNQRYKMIRAWGVPRILTQHLGSRSSTQWLLGASTNSYHEPIHLLGASGSMMDDYTCSLDMNVMGLDSANPIVMGLKGLRLLDSHWVHLPRPLDYMTHRFDEAPLPEAVRENLAFMYRLIGNQSLRNEIMASKAAAAAAATANLVSGIPDGENGSTPPVRH